MLGENSMSGASSVAGAGRSDGLHDMTDLGSKTWSVRAGVSRLCHIAEAMDGLHKEHMAARTATRRRVPNTQFADLASRTSVPASIGGVSRASSQMTPPATPHSVGLNRDAPTSQTPLRESERQDLNELLRQQEENLRIIEDAFKAHVRRYKRDKAGRSTGGSAEGKTTAAEALPRHASDLPIAPEPQRRGGCACMCMHVHEVARQATNDTK